MSKRPPHGGKPPGAARRPAPKKRGPKREALFIEDIDEAFRRIWQRKKRTK